MHQGKEWDYVFDVDVAEGAPPRKLPYNRGENPYIAADRFIEEEGLPLYFKEQVGMEINHSDAAGLQDRRGIRSTVLHSILRNCVLPLLTALRYVALNRPASGALCA